MGPYDQKIIRYWNITSSKDLFQRVYHVYWTKEKDETS